MLCVATFCFVAALQHPHVVIPQSEPSKHTRLPFREADEHIEKDYMPIHLLLAPYRQVLHNHKDVQYYGDVYVGGQSVRAIFDTGSFEVLVFGKSCVSCGSQKLLYNHSASKDYRKGKYMAQHTFGSGTTFAKEAYDTVQVGPLKSEHQQVWEVYDADMPLLEDSSFQAILGVGPPGSAEKLSKSGNATVVAMPQIPHASVDSDVALTSKLQVNSYSVCIGRKSSSPGYFVWGDVRPEDGAGHGIFTSLKVEGDVHWAVRLSNVRMGQESKAYVGCQSGCAAVIDSGTSLIAAPTEVIQKVDEALERLNEDCSNLWELPDLVFLLDGKEFSLPPDAYVGRTVEEGGFNLRNLVHFRFRSRHISCVPLFMDIDMDSQLGPMWILGLPFFRKYYTTLSYRYEHKRQHVLDKHVSVALSDDRCEPTMGNSLLSDEARRRDMVPRVIDPALLRMPSWVEAASTNGFLRV
jgi:hypothetical protein